MKKFILGFLVLFSTAAFCQVSDDSIATQVTGFRNAGIAGITKNKVADAIQNLNDSKISNQSWATGSSYSAGKSFVIQNNILYKCLVSHTAGTFSTDLAANRWVAISATTDASQLTTGTISDARLSSNVVTTSGAQTLSNKIFANATIDYNANTILNLPSSALPTTATLSGTSGIIPLAFTGNISYTKIVQTGNITFSGTCTTEGARALATVDGDSSHSFTFPGAWVRENSNVADNTKRNRISAKCSSGEIVYNIVTSNFPDVTPPTLVSAATNTAGTQITLTYSETLGSVTPANSDYTPSGGKTITAVNVTGSTAVLTVSSAYLAGATITLSYVPGTNKIQDVAGNFAASLTNQSVTNNVPSIPALTTIKIVALGNSVDQGYHSYSATSDFLGPFINARVASPITVSYTNSAVIGEPFSSTYSRLATNLSSDPNLVWCGLGLNDAVGTATDVRADLRSFVNNVLAHTNADGTKPSVFFCYNNQCLENPSGGTARPYVAQTQVHTWFLQVMAEYAGNPRVGYADPWVAFNALWGGTDGSSPNLSALLSDGLHPNDVGRNVINDHALHVAFTFLNPLIQQAEIPVKSKQSFNTDGLSAGTLTDWTSTQGMHTSVKYSTAPTVVSSQLSGYPALRFDNGIAYQLPSTVNILTAVFVLRWQGAYDIGYASPIGDLVGNSFLTIPPGSPLLVTNGYIDAFENGAQVTPTSIVNTTTFHVVAVRSNLAVSVINSDQQQVGRCGRWDFVDLELFDSYTTDVDMANVYNRLKAKYPALP